MKYYSYKQYKLMKDSLSLFDRKKIELPDLINRLESLFLCIDKEDQIENFYEEWGGLESIFAVNLFKGVIKLSSTQQTTIERTTERLKKMIGVAASRYLSQWDPSVTKKAIPIDNNIYMCPQCSEILETSKYEPVMLVCPKCDTPWINPNYKT